MSVATTLYSAAGNVPGWGLPWRLGFGEDPGELVRVQENTPENSCLETLLWAEHLRNPSHWASQGGWWEAGSLQPAGPQSRERKGKGLPVANRSFTKPAEVMEEMVNPFQLWPFLMATAAIAQGGEHFSGCSGGGFLKPYPNTSRELQAWCKDYKI